VQKINKEIIILVALEDELPKSLLPEFHIEYIGVGKINASYRTFEIIEKYAPKTIINFGTAGSLNKKINGLNEVTIFKQRDMDASELGFDLGETPFDNLSTIEFNENGLSCGTGDSFVSEKPKVPTDLVDMEAYAIAKICLIKNVNFKCYKYISDNADEDAGNNWKENINKGSLAFVEKLKLIYEK
jgi:adenosylhomocysteine nucleosidase